MWRVFFVGIFLLMGCGRIEKGSSKYRETQELMGTIIQVDVCTQGLESNQIQEAYEDVWKRLEEIAWRMNVFDVKSDLTKINESKKSLVAIEADTYQVIQDAIKFSQWTGGAFDITVWPLIQLWKAKEEANQMPSMKELLEVKASVGMANIELLDHHQVRLRHQDTKLDLGGIAKGYAVDEAARIFREHGVERFFIDAGGDVYVGGRNCQGRPWRIGIRDPRDVSKILDVIEVQDAAVTTSGNYERYFEIQGQRWSHIIDPVSGYPQKEVISATVIAPTAQDADALSTALTVLGSQKGIALIDKLGGQYKSLIMVKDGDNKIKKFLSQGYSYFLEP